MAIYTVHAPISYGIDPRVTADKLVFVRDGFYVWAFVAAVIWLIWNRLWLALFGYLVLSVVAEIGLRYVGASADTRILVMIVFAFLVGLEAGSLRRWKLSRGKWKQLDVVVADSEEAAERRFFDREQASSGARVGTAGNSPMRPLPRASLTQDDVVGFFPETGAPR